MLDRRSFLFSLFAAPLAFVSGFARGETKKKTVTLAAGEADKSMVKETDAMAAALRYQADASKAKDRSNPKAFCSNCMQYNKAVGADGKETKVGGDEVGTCNLFNGGKGVVKGKGWCMSWYQAPA